MYKAPLYSWWKASQLPIYKARPASSTLDYQEQIQLLAWWKIWPPNFKSSAVIRFATLSTLMSFRCGDTYLYVSFHETGAIPSLNTMYCQDPKPLLPYLLRWLIYLCQLQVDKQPSVSLTRRRNQTISLKTNTFVLSHLGSSSFRVVSEVCRVRTVRHNILCHPLISVLPALGSNSCRLDNADKTHLEPLIVISGSDAPWPAVVQPAVPWRQMVIVIRRCR